MSAKDLVTVVPTSSLTGSFVFEKGVPTGLADFEDGDTITEGTKPSFEQKNSKLHTKVRFSLFQIYYWNRKRLV